MKSIKKNIFMNMVLKASAVLFPLITFPYVSRVLMADGLGKVSFASAVVSYFTMLAQLGIPTYGITMCARVRDDRDELSKTVHEILAVNLATMILSYALFFILLGTVERFSADRGLMLVTSITVLFNTFGAEWLYSAMEQYTYITVRSLGFKVVSLAAIFLFIHEQKDYMAYAVILMAASVGSNIFNLARLGKYVSFKKYENYHLKRHLKPVLVFFAMSVATTVYTSLDSVMLGFLKTDTDVGYYNAATKVKTVLVSLVTSLGAVLLPRSSYYIKHGRKDEFLRISRKAMDFIFFAAVPVTVYFILFARESVELLSGRDFLGAVPAMQIIMPSILFIGMTNLMGIQMLVPLGKEKYVLYSEIAGAVLDFVLNLLLIPRYAAAGAAFSTLLAEMAVFLVQYFFLRDTVGNVFQNIKIFSFFAAGGAAGVLSVGLRMLDCSRLVLLVLSAVVYFTVYLVCMHLFKNPTEQMIQEMVRGVLLRRRKNVS